MSPFVALLLEALRDAARRRSLFAAAAASAVLILGVNRCSGCNAALSVQGASVQAAQIAGVTAIITFGLLSLWTLGLVALLASDSLASTLEDGSTESILARPVARHTLVLARLLGTYTGALAVGLGVLGASVALIHLRQGLPLAPASWATLALVLGGVIAAALAMTISLFVPRTAALLGSWATIAIVATANGLRLATGHSEGLLGLVDRLGPPWLSAIVVPLWPWLAGAEIGSPPDWLLTRLAAWALLSAGLLVVGFRRIELPR